MRFLVVLMTLFATARVAHADCGRGKLLFRIESTSNNPLAEVGDGAGTTSTEVRTTGAWTVVDGAGTRSGCLDKARLALVVRAVKHARLVHVRGGACDAVSTEHDVYTSARGTIDTDSPCGVPVDPGTDAAAACVAGAVDDKVSDATLATTCAVSGAAPKPCKRGGLLLRTTTEPIPDAPNSDPSVIVLEAQTTGAWRSTVDKNLQGSGCLSAARRKLLRAAVAKASFTSHKVDAACRELATQQITYQGPKKRQHVTVAAVCPNPVADDATTVAGACLAAVVDDEVSDDVLAAVCRPQTDQ